MAKTGYYEVFLKEWNMGRKKMLGRFIIGDIYDSEACWQISDTYQIASLPAIRIVSIMNPREMEGCTFAIGRGLNDGVADFTKEDHRVLEILKKINQISSSLRSKNRLQYVSD